MPILSQDKCIRIHLFHKMALLLSPFGSGALAFCSLSQQLLLQAAHCFSEPASPRGRASPNHLQPFQSLGQCIFLLPDQSQPDVV